MKRMLTICMIFILLALTGCAFIGNDAETDEASTETPTTSQIVGTWETIIPMDLSAGLLDYSLVVTYSLNGTGRETLSYAPLDWSMYLDFTWTASNGVITVTTEEGGITTTTSVTYGVIGDALTTYANGITRTLSRVR